MIVAIHQPHYLPWLRYMHKIASCDVFVLLDDAQYEKNGWQNRNKIKGPQGPILLTVPVRDPSFKSIIAVEIDNQTSWSQRHWKSIIFNYRRAPFFWRYAGILEQTLMSEWKLLAPLNVRLITELVKALGIGAELVLSSSLGVVGRGTEKLVQICRRLGATRYLSGAFAAGNHLDERMFADSRVSVGIQAWQCPLYRQCFGGFIPDLSVIDLLLNEGPNARSLIASEQRRLSVSVGWRQSAGLAPNHGLRGLLDDR